MGFSAAVRRILALVVLATGAWAAALTVGSEPMVTGASGEYVTLGFSLVGSGQFNYSVLAPEGWEPLTRTGRVVVDGQGYVSVTVRVPRSAPAQSQARIELAFSNVDDAGDTASGRGFVTVLGSVDLELSAPSSLEGELGEPFAISMLLVNRGNMPDTVSLSGDGGMWDVRFEANPVRLEQGEERLLQVVLVPQGQVSSGYRHVLRVSATSANDPEVSARAFVETLFYDSSRRAGAAASENPRLTVALRSGVAAGFSSDGSGLQPHLSYGVTPRLSGELSDYVEVSAGVGELSGTITDPFAQVPSRFDVALEAENWDAAANLGDGSYRLAGGGVVNDWRLGGGGDYRDTLQGGAFGVNAYAISQLPELDLQFAARSAQQPTGRMDSLGARYRTSLGDGLVLSAGTNLSGNVTPGGYEVAFGVDESLSYQTQFFDVTQSYSGVPAAGLHNVGVSGGFRTAGIFGARASSSLQLSSGTSSWRHSVTLSSRPLPRVTLAVSGSLRLAETQATWSVRPTATFRYGGAGLGGTFSVHYGHTGVLRGDVATLNQYGVNANLRAGALTLSSAANYRVSSATSSDPSGDSFEVSFNAGYALGLSTELAAAYDLEADTVAGNQTGTAEVVWTQSWTGDISSQLSYDRSETLDYASGLIDHQERLALVGQVTDLAIDGLNLSAGYAVGSTTGLLTGLTPLTHDFSVRLSYTLLFSFDTPPAAVNLFGGRRGGAVSGVAYFDRNLDGRRDPGEETVAGLEVVLGGESVVTANDGSFRLRTAVGDHDWSFGAGLPGAVALMNDERVVVSENSSQQIDLAFSPVARVKVSLFDDVDQDGERDPEESGISFAGVRIDGPIQRAIRLDARGVGMATGLVPGRYVVIPDPAALPPRFRATSEPLILEIREGDAPAEIALGAAAPPREVVTTFQAGSLAVIGRVDKSRVEVGEPLQVTALVSGNAERVIALLGDLEIELTGSGSMWSGELIVPERIGAGAAMLVIRASAGEGAAEVVAQAEVGIEVLTGGE